MLVQWCKKTIDKARDYVEIICISYLIIYPTILNLLLHFK